MGRRSFTTEFKHEAVKLVRETMGLDNVWVMIPFVRTLDEGCKVLEVLRENGLVQGENGFHSGLTPDFSGDVTLKSPPYSPNDRQVQTWDFSTT